MKYLQIAACIFCVWLVFFRQEARGIILMRHYCTISLVLTQKGPIQDPNELNREKLKQALTQVSVYSSEIEGTSLFEVSTTGWTKREAEAHLDRAFTELQRQMPNRIKWFDKGMPPLRWQLFGAVVGLMLAGMVGTIKRPAIIFQDGERPAMGRRSSAVSLRSRGVILGKAILSYSWMDGA